MFKDMCNVISGELAQRFKRPLLQVDIQGGKLLINRLDSMDEYYGYYRYEEDSNGLHY